MRKLLLSFIATVLILMGVSALTIGAEDMSDEGINEVELTDEQKNELAALYKEAFDTKKEIINKYVEYGVFTEEKGEKIISKFEKHYGKIEENGYIPKWDKHHKDHCKRKKCD